LENLVKTLKKICSNFFSINHFCTGFKTIAQLSVAKVIGIFFDIFLIHHCQYLKSRRF